MRDLFVIGTASIDVLHIGDSTVNTVGGAGLYTALAARCQSDSVALFAPRPHPTEMPDALKLVATHLDWRGPQVELAMMPRLEIRHHGGGKATLVGASWGAETFFESDALPTDLSDWRYVHIAALSSAQRQLEFMRACRERGAKRLSVGTYARIVYGETEKVRQLYCEADVGFMNENEANGLFGSVDDAIRHIRPEQVLCITLAERGAVILHNNERFVCTAPAIQEVDPTGAGDTVCGTFLALLAQGLRLPDCGQHAVYAATQMIQFVGPTGLVDYIRTSRG